MTHSAGTRWALVTGASSGIGRATAERLAAAGYSVLLVARDVMRLEREAARLRANHAVSVETVAVDLADASAAAQVDAATRERPVEVAVLAAGYGSVGRFDSRELADEVAMVQVNCISVVDLAGRFVRRFRQQGHGHLVLYSSIVGFGGVAYSATYAATKNFVQAFAEGLQGELAGTGVTVLCVAPGPIATGFAQRAGMRMGQAPGPDTVARATLASLTRSTTIRPGVMSKLLHYSLVPLGRRGRSWVLGRVMRGIVADVA